MNSDHNTLQNIPAFQDIITFLKTEEHPGWETFVERCEKWAVSLETHTRTHSAEEIQALDRLATQTLTPLVEQAFPKTDIKPGHILPTTERIAPTTWFIPTLHIPWAARFARCIDLSCQHGIHAISRLFRQIPSFLRSQDESTYQADHFNTDLLRRCADATVAFPQLELINLRLPSFIDTEALEQFRDAYNRHSTLHTLQLVMDSVTPLQTFALHPWPQLQTLHIHIHSANPFPPIPANAFPSIKRISINVPDGIQLHIQQFLRAEHFAQVEELQLQAANHHIGTTLSTESIEQLCAFPNLHTLRLYNLYMDETSLSTLIQTLPPHQLKTLSFRSMKEGTSLDRLFKEATRRPLLSTLETLVFDPDVLSAKALGHFLSQSSLTLKHIECESIHTLDPYLQAIYENPIQQQLESLIMSYGSISQHCIKAFVNQLGPSALHTLSVTVEDVGQLNLEDCRRIFQKQTTSERFAHLRRGLAEHSDATYWLTLQQELNGWDENDEYKNVVLPYVLEHIKSWNEEPQPSDWIYNSTKGKRPLGYEWLTRLMTKGGFPALCLVDTVSTRRPEVILPHLMTPELANVENLHLLNDTTRPRGKEPPKYVEQLTTLPFWGTLKHLTFQPERPYSPKKFAQLFKTLSGCVLTSLCLKGPGAISSLPTKDLETAGIFRTLKELYFHSILFMTKALIKLTHLEGWENIETLVIHHNNYLTQAQLGEVIQNTPRLKHLSLEHCQLGPGLIKTLQAGPLPHLETLHLRGNDLGTSDFDDLDNVDWPSLQVVHIS